MSDQLADQPQTAATANDKTAEQYVIGAALLGRNWAGALTLSLPASAFYRPIHVKIWEAIRHVLDTEDAYDFNGNMEVEDSLDADDLTRIFHVDETSESTQQPKAADQ